MISCKECQSTFDNEKSFHGHLRKHKLKIKEYYEKHYPKNCLQTGKKLQWKDGDDLLSYSSRNFIDKIALNQYFLSESDSAETVELKKKILEEFIEDSYKRNLVFPSEIELASLPIAPNLLIFQKYFGIPEFLDGKKMPSRFNYVTNYSLDLELPKVDFDEFTILVDTREQAPYRFFSSIKGKLNSGDYALAGKLFNDVVVERKSVSDFGGTVVSGNERFRRELDRVREEGRYLIILVEFNIHDLYKHKFYGYSNPAFVSHNMRGLIRDYSDCCQFVFGGARTSCIKYCVQFLLYGQKCRQIDLQLFVDSHDNVFHGEEFDKNDLMSLYDNKS